MPSVELELSPKELLAKYRRIMNSIHFLGNIFVYPGRMQAYTILALAASELRQREMWRV